MDTNKILKEININNYNFNILFFFDTKHIETDIMNFYELTTYKIVKQNNIKIISCISENISSDLNKYFFHSLKYLSLIISNNNTYSNGVINIYFTPDELKKMLNDKIIKFKYGEFKIHFLNHFDKYVVTHENNKKRKKDVDFFYYAHKNNDENKFLSGFEIIIDNFKLKDLFAEAFLSKI